MDAIRGDKARDTGYEKVIVYDKPLTSPFPLTPSQRNLVPPSP
jgi:hypothetical protein